MVSARNGVRGGFSIFCAGLLALGAACTGDPGNDGGNDDSGDDGTEQPFCGDGNVDSGEACDDGANNSDAVADACRTDCTEPTCGDGTRDTGEACDAGADNSDTVADACRTDCSEAACGDNTVDTGEACDDGVDNGADVAGACRVDCTSPTCGDGTKDPGEECDAGELNSDTESDACRSGCKLPTCGDGVRDTDEQCDLGTDNNDTAPGVCRTSCRFPTCGDGIHDPGEACDRGAENSDTNPDACRTDCSSARCGDGAKDTGEECDDGYGNNDRISDACRSDCRLPVCGDGVVDGTETCDDGGLNSDTRPDACRTDCAAAGCGDGVLDEGEPCDDGAQNSDTTPDACRLDCSLPSCGDGTVDSLEQCDDGSGNGKAADQCRPSCIDPMCGDTIVDTGEGCDDKTIHCLAYCKPAASLLGKGCPAYDAASPGFVAGTVCNYVAAMDEAFRTGDSTTASNLLDLWTATYPRCSETITLVSGTFTVTTPRLMRYYQHYCLRTNVNCPVWTVESCTSYQRQSQFSDSLCLFGACPTVDSSCDTSWSLSCPSIYADECPPPTTLAECDPTQLSVNYSADCQRYVQNTCWNLATSSCASPTLDTCSAFHAGATPSPADCAWYLTKECDGIYEELCPQPSLNLCKGLPDTLTNHHVACQQLVTDRCVNWEERFCDDSDPLLPTALNADSCVEHYANLQTLVVPECEAWLAATCEQEIVDDTQAHHAAVQGCEGHLMVPTGTYNYSKDYALAEPSRFDCSPNEQLLVHPHELAFDDDGNAGLYELAVAAVEFRLGGARVASCEEWIQQKYWTYEAFDTYTSLFEHDARQVMQLAYSDHVDHRDYAIGWRAQNLTTPFGFYPDQTLALTTTNSGGSYANGPDGYSYVAYHPKNDFVDLAFWGNRSALADFLSTDLRASNPIEADGRNTRNAAIAAKLDPLKEYWPHRTRVGPDDSWQWHQRMSQGLRNQGHSDTEANYLHDRRLGFRELLEEHRQVVEWMSFWNTNSSLPNAGLRLLELQTRRNALADEIEDLMVDADDRGCFRMRRDANGVPIPDLCDWSPRDFVEDVDDAYDRVQQRDLDYCLKYAPADFSTLTSGYSYLERTSAGSVDRTTNEDAGSSVVALETYLQRRKETLELLRDHLGNTTERNRPLWGQNYGDAEEVGDRDWFAAGYSYNLGWEVALPPVPPGETPDRNNLCGINLTADAGFNAYTYVANGRMDVIDAVLAADVRQDQFMSTLSIFEVPIWSSVGKTGAADEISSIDYQFSAVYGPATHEVSDSYNTTVPLFSLAGFNLVLSLGASGSMGIDLTGGFKMSVHNVEDCGPGFDAGLFSKLEPFARFDGFAQLGVNIWIIEVGIGGEFNIISASLPTDIDANISAPGVLAFEADFQVAMKTGLHVSALSGRLYMYARILWSTYKKTIFRWDGLEWYFPIFDKTYSYKLGLVFDYCNLPGVSCL